MATDHVFSVNQLTQEEVYSWASGIQCSNWLRTLHSCHPDCKLSHTSKSRQASYCFWPINSESPSPKYFSCSMNITYPRLQMQFLYPPSLPGLAFIIGYGLWLPSDPHPDSRTGAAPSRPRPVPGEGAIIAKLSNETVSHTHRLIAPVRSGTLENKETDSRFPVSCRNLF